MIKLILAGAVTIALCTAAYYAGYHRGQYEVLREIKDLYLPAAPSAGD